MQSGGVSDPPADTQQLFPPVPAPLRRAAEAAADEAGLRAALLGLHATVGELHPASLAVARRLAGALCASAGGLAEGLGLLQGAAESCGALLGAGDPLTLATLQDLLRLTGPGGLAPSPAAACGAARAILAGCAAAAAASAASLEGGGVLPSLAALAAHTSVILARTLAAPDDAAPADLEEAAEALRGAVAGLLRAGAHAGEAQVLRRAVLSRLQRPREAALPVVLAAASH